MRPPTIHLEYDFRLPLTPDEAWEIVADTNSLNALIGFSPTELTLTGKATYGNAVARITMKNFPWLGWEERPWDFIRPSYYRVRRDYFKGPLLDFEGGAEIRPDGDGVLVHLTGNVTPRLAFLAPVIKRAALKEMKKTGDRLTEALARRAKTGQAVYSPPPTAAGAGGAERLARGMEQVRKAATPDVADRLGVFLATATDFDVLRIRPFELADRWHLPRVDVLRALLHATTAQILNMTWDLMCPHCRLPTVRGKSLRDVKTDGECPSCNLEFAISLENAVEVSFSLHPSVRPIEPVVFCLGAPAKKPGLLFQQLLGPREKRPVTLHLASGEYTLMRTDTQAELLVRVGARGGPTRVAARSNDEGMRTDGGASSVDAGEGDVTFEIENVLDAPAKISLAHAAAASDSASAAMVTSFQDFRDLFSDEVLAEGVQMGVSSMTLLFTDLKGSTALYEQFGDAPIFRRVREHFDVLIAAVSAEGGGVVKTIGDAVMATFPSPAAGVRAAIAMQRRIQALNARLGPPHLVVKLGLHTGPCLVINANGRLDYFGNAVNTAARIEGQSAGGDLVMTSQVARDEEVASILADPAFKTTTFDATLKGLSGSQKLTRLELHTHVEGRNVIAVR